MYRDIAQWSSIRKRILCHGVAIRQVARETGISRNTIRKMVAHPRPQPYGRRSRTYPKLGPHISSLRRMLQENTAMPPSARLSIKAIYERIREEEAFRGSYSSVRNFVLPITTDKACIWEYTVDLLNSLEKKQAIDFLFLLSHADPPLISKDRTESFFRGAGRVIDVPRKTDKRKQARQAAFEWMRRVLQKEVSPDVLCQEISDTPDFVALLDRLYNGRLSDRNRSMAVLANRRGLNGATICSFLGINKRTCRNYLRAFEDGGHTALFARQTKSIRKFDNEAIKQAVFGLLHEPPSNYNINRSTWIMRDLTRVLREKGQPVCPGVICRITKAAGYKWRKAKIVLTSNDPTYVEKLARIRSILSKLQPDEAFFSIDEYGPFAVKTKPGRSLVPPGTQPTVPQWQKSRGCMIITAALDLPSNQVTHFYSTKKNTGEMIRMMDILVERYAKHRKLYLSWDAASWHISKKLFARIESHNAAVANGSGPIVETVPLPAGAQFLNVIESVFSGMARAIIHNSDYKSVDEVKTAIDRYFADRNTHFLQHPQRAGRKIWGKERELADFSAANNCKDPRYR